MNKPFDYKTLIKLFVFATVVFAPVQVSWAQNLFPLSGGTRFEPDPDNKKQLVLVAENSEVKITIKPAEKFKPKKGQIWTIWMKVENLSDKPLKFDPTQFTATDDEGRAYAGLEATVAIKRFNDAIAAVTNMIGSAIAGPLAGPSVVASSERGSAQKLNQESMQIGDIPPKTFKDGIVYFEKAKEKTLQSTNSRSITTKFIRC